MCGIVGAVAQRNITPVLIEGLKRLEYRGYDSCGVALHVDGHLARSRSTSRVADLETQIQETHLQGFTGIAHTRWATHGRPRTMRTHTSRPAATMRASHWSTTASSRTTTSCATS
jgi:glutamine---fructose-6-phosphate transaminase (isomerizing)